MNLQYHKRTIRREVIQSRYLDQEKETLIYLPPEYEVSQLYPWLIVHDGSDYLQLGRLATITHQLIKEGRIEPLLIVMVPVDKSLRTQEYSVLGDRTGSHKQFIVSELLPFIEQNYSVHPDPQYRVIGGASLGGTVSLHISLEHPDLFPQVMAQSGAFYEETQSILKEIPSCSYLTLYQSIGDREQTVPTHRGSMDFVQLNQETYTILQQKQAKVLYQRRDGEHNWRLWQQDLPIALRFFFSSTK